MKFKKQYHTLQADKTWKPTFSEMVEMDAAEADRQNKNFGFSGVKYTPELTQEQAEALVAAGKAGAEAAAHMADFASKLAGISDEDEKGQDEEQAAKEIASIKSFDDAVDATLHNQVGEAIDGKTEVPGPGPELPAEVAAPADKPASED